MKGPHESKRRLLRQSWGSFLVAKGAQGCPGGGWRHRELGQGWKQGSYTVAAGSISGFPQLALHGKWGQKLGMEILLSDIDHGPAVLQGFLS